MTFLNRRDAALTVTKACPAAGANVNTATIDTGSAGDASLANAVVEVAIPALPSLADTKTVTVKLQDSADDTTYADIAELASVVVTGSGVAGSAKKTAVVRLPPGALRYLQANIAVAASGGDNTAKSVTLSLLT